jgi:lysophospholipase L1-like esterase
MLGGVSLLAMAAAIAGAGKAAAQEGPEGLGYSSYIALGDSYSSGEGATTLIEGDACDRSQSGWVYRTEADIGAPPFVHAACSGATTADILAQGPKFAAQGGIPQIDYLPPSDQLDGALITIQIGGNDLRLESACISGVKLDDGSGGLGAIPPECQDVEYTYENLTETVALLASNLDYIYQDVRTRAPNATIVAIGYPHLFGSANPDCENIARLLRLPPDFLQKFNAIIDAGNAQIKATAESLGILAITDEIATAFEGHEMCSDDEWLVSLTTAARISQIGHPSDYGHQMMAEVITPLLPYNVNTHNGTVTTEQQGDGGQVGEPGVPPGAEEGLPGGQESSGDENESP